MNHPSTAVMSATAPVPEATVVHELPKVDPQVDNSRSWFVHVLRLY
jgi:hypothetical protein